MKISLITISLLVAVMIYGCSTTKPLNELRATKEGLKSTELVSTTNIEDVIKRIKADAYNNGSLLKIFDTPDGTKVSLVRQLDYGGEIMCFMDFEKEGNGVRVSVYNYVCGQGFIDKTLKMALNR